MPRAPVYSKSFWCKITRVPEILHGKTSLVHHNGKGIFKDVPTPFAGARYHSLIATDIPEVLQITAKTSEGIIMGLRHREWPVIGLQFHPESFLSENGLKLIKNFMDI